MYVCIYICVCVCVCFIYKCKYNLNPPVFPNEQNQPTEQETNVNSEMKILSMSVYTGQILVSIEFHIVDPTSGTE